MARIPDLRRSWDDVWPVILVLIAGLLGTRAATENQLEWSPEPDLFAYILVVVAALSLVLRRRRPGATVVLCGGAVATYLVFGYAFGPILFAIPVATFTLAAAWPLGPAVAWNSGLWLAVVAAGAARFEAGTFTDHGLGWLGASLAAVAVPTAAGVVIRIRRESEAGVRAEQARRAVSEERLRMAQELHDSVGHGLAVIAMQAGVALHVLDRNPAKARETLQAIRDASRESLDSLRSELQVLRRPDGELEPRRPDPGLADLGVLLDRIRGGGIEVEADIRVADVSPDVDVAVYRVLQESLTNVLWHADATAARVRLRQEGSHLVVDVTDNGSGTAGGVAGAGRTANASEGSGSGIPGMRARVEALGGELEAGPRSGGGFAVTARLPHSPAVPQGAGGVTGSGRSRTAGPKA